MKLGLLAVTAALAFISVVAGARAQNVESSFVYRGEYKRPQFDPGDEKLVRDFAKGMGLEFNQDMQLPICVFRTRLASAGGFADGSRFEGAGVVARIPFSNYEYVGLSLAPKTKSHYSDYPREPFLELRGDDEGKGLTWTAYLVLPPMTAKGFPLGPPFRAVHVRWEGKSVPTQAISVIPGMPVRIQLKGLPDVWGAGEAFEAVVANLAPASDPGRIRVTIAQSLSALGRDVARLEQMYRTMAERDKRGQCGVFPNECFDGECGL